MLTLSDCSKAVSWNYFRTLIFYLRLWADFLSKWHSAIMKWVVVTYKDRLLSVFLKCQNRRYNVRIYFKNMFFKCQTISYNPLSISMVGSPIVSVLSKKHSLDVLMSRQYQITLSQLWKRLIVVVVSKTVPLVSIDCHSSDMKKHCPSWDWSELLMSVTCSYSE